MWEWLTGAVDPGRAHEVDLAVSWHGRIMTLAWGLLAPLAVFVARFLKVMPGQDWPRELDNPFWWRTHWIGQTVVFLLTLLGIALIWQVAARETVHGRFGYLVLALATVQVGLGVFRGSKGGPTAPARDGSLRGDHYDMTPRRLLFEVMHKSIGYLAIATAIATLLIGLWLANAPRWMWLILLVWWVALISVAAVLQVRGWAVDTYQAIWGPDPGHPGNRRAAPGWGMRRKPGHEDAGAGPKEQDPWRC